MAAMLGRHVSAAEENHYNLILLLVAPTQSPILLIFKSPARAE